jgi:hypothetical protein
MYLNIFVCDYIESFSDLVVPVSFLFMSVQRPMRGTIHQCEFENFIFFFPVALTMAPIKDSTRMTKDEPGDPRVHIEVLMFQRRRSVWLYCGGCLLLTCEVVIMLIYFT